MFKLTPIDEIVAWAVQHKITNKYGIARRYKRGFMYERLEIEWANGSRTWHAGMLIRVLGSDVSMLDASSDGDDDDDGGDGD